MSGTALADKNNPDGNFLCPIVGNQTAADANGQGWSGVGAGYTFFPHDGNNQAGAHANNHAINAEGPGTSPGPGGGNTEWSPIWPGP